MEDQENAVQGELTDFTLSKSILKSNNLHHPSNTSSQVPLKDESNTTRTFPKRRVSFAPEVTLHKIDFVPQYRSDSSADGDGMAGGHGSQSSSKRRETIAYFPSSSDSSSQEVDASEDDKLVEAVGVEVLHDSSDDEEEDDGAPIQSSIPIPTSLPSDTEDEMTMEITEPLPKIISVTHEAESAVNTMVSPSIPKDVQEDDDDDNEGGALAEGEEEEMELTVNVGQSVAQVEMTEENKHIVTETKVFEVEQRTEHTESSLTTIEEVSTRISTITVEEGRDNSETNVPSNLEQTGAEDEEEEMQLTQSISTFKGAPPIKRIEEIRETLDEDEQEYHDSLDELFEEQTMELTQQVGKIKSKESVDDDANSNQSDDDSQVQIKFPRIQQNRVEEIEKDENDMELTQQVGVIYNQQDLDLIDHSKDNEEAEGGDMEEDMEFTQQVGSLKKATTSDREEPEAVGEVPPIVKLAESPELVEKKSEPAADSHVNEAIAPSLSNKRKLDESLTKTVEPPSKIHHHYMSATTSTIPLAEINDSSMLEDNSEIFNPVSLSQFMDDIGIRFYDDLEIGSQSQKRISISLPKVKAGGEEDTFSMKDYVMAIIQVPNYELGEFSCNELTQNIQEGIKIFETINESTSSMNPRLFKEYYETIPDAQLGMKTQFQLIKDYSRQEAKKVWYGWRSQLINNVIEELQKSITKLTDDRNKLLKGIEQINEVNEVVVKKQQALKSKLEIFRQLIKSSQTIDQESLNHFLTEMGQVKEHIQQFGREIKEQTGNLLKLNDMIKVREEKIASLNAENKEISNVIQKNKKYDVDEINLLIFKFNLLQSTAKCKIIKEDETKKGMVTDEDTRNLIRFEYDSSVIVSINFNRLSESKNSFKYDFKHESPVFKIPELYRVFSKKREVLESLIESEQDDAVKKFHRFRSIWENLRKLDAYLYKISLKFPIRIDETTGHVIVKYFNGEAQSKLELSIDIDIDTLVVKEVTIKTIRMGGIKDKKDVLGNFKKECINNELINSIDAVKWVT